LIENGGKRGKEGKSRTQDFKNKVFKEQPTLNETFKAKRKSHKAQNIAKF
jgi:hemoglobin-like flavoprotein